MFLPAARGYFTYLRLPYFTFDLVAFSWRSVLPLGLGGGGRLLGGRPGRRCRPSARCTATRRWRAPPPTSSAEPPGPPAAKRDRRAARSAASPPPRRRTCVPPPGRRRRRCRRRRRRCHDRRQRRECLATRRWKAAHVVTNGAASRGREHQLATERRALVELHPGSPPGGAHSAHSAPVGRAAAAAPDPPPPEEEGRRAAAGMRVSHSATTSPSMAEASSRQDGGSRGA